MEQVKWFERKFDFTQTQNIFPSLLERLSGTPIRLEQKLASLKPSILVDKIDGKWSIKENVGHLIDLEPLWQGRLEDIKSGKPELRPTDLTNSKTDLENHNGRPLHELLTTFRQVRQETIALLEGIDEATLFKSALHPRLKTPMRIIDLFLFVADHDDHHLAAITRILNTLTGQK